MTLVVVVVVVVVEKGREKVEKSSENLKFSMFYNCCNFNFLDINYKSYNINNKRHRHI